MENEAIKTQEGQLVLFSRGESVEDLIYEFLKDRSPLTERAAGTVRVRILKGRLIRQHISISATRLL